MGNPSIRSLAPIGRVLDPPDEAGVGGRPLLNLTFAVSYACGGTNPWGYHAFNLGVHVLAGVTLFLVVRRSLRQPMLAPSFGAPATLLALLVASIWAWHPVQTESVTYVSQRAEELMGLFYLLTLYCFIRAVDTEVPASILTWLVLCVICCLGAAATKEVAATAPLAVFFYDRCFVSGTFRRAWSRHGRLYLALSASLFPIGHRVLSLLRNPLTYGVGFGGGIAWWNYALTESRVVLGYLGLALWPNPLVFDYGRTVPCDPIQTWPYALALGALLIAVMIAVVRWPAAGFAGAWFFLILAPTSSVVPIVGEYMAESRMYLSLAGLAALAVAVAYAKTGAYCIPVFALIAAVLGHLSYERNLLYLNEEALWRDTIAKRPSNARAHGNLGRVLAREPGRLDEAIDEYFEAIRLDPKAPELHVNLGNLYYRSVDGLDKAADQYEEALELDPGDALAHFDLGCALAGIPGRGDDAIAQYREALRLKPELPSAHYNLGNALLRKGGQVEGAVSEYEAAVRLRPDWADAHFALALAFQHWGNHDEEAKRQLEEVVRLQPQNEEARKRLETYSRPPGA